MNPLPDQPGSYLLVLELAEPAGIQIGRGGRVDFPAGVYAYAGSAFGPGGLRARLSHHMRIAARPHWHIDGLRREAQLLAVGWHCGVEARLECAWAGRLARHPSAIIPVRGFGASDCRNGCAAHLVGLPAGFEPTTVLVWVGIGPERRVLAGGGILG